MSSITTKEAYVRELKAVCEDIIEHAEEWMPEPEWTSEVTFSVTLSYEAIPTLRITTEKISKKAVAEIHRIQYEKRDDR